MLKRGHEYLITFLRWSERYTGTDMVYLFHGGFWLSLGQVITSLSGFLLTLILANLLAPERLGEYRFLIAGFTLIGVIALPGMRTALRESTPKGYRGNLTLAFKAMMRWGFIGSLISLCIAGYYLAEENINLAIGFIVISLTIPFYNASTGYLEYLTALKELRRVSFYTSFGRIAVLIVTATTAWVFPDVAWAILAAYLCGAMLPNIWFHIQTVNTATKPGDAADPGIIRYAGHITVMTALGVIAGQLDKLFVWNFIGASGLALFYIAYAIPLTISQYLLIIPTLAFAKFGEKDPYTIRQTLLPKLLKYFFMIACGAALYIVIAPYLFTVLFPQYIDAIPYAQVLILTVLFTAFMPIKTFLTTTKNTKALYLLSVIPSAIRILVAILLIAPFGIWGAVCSLLLEGIIRTIFLLFFFIRTPKQPRINTTTS